jgi:hypothetical protein
MKWTVIVASVVALLSAMAGADLIITEDFSSNPAARGWVDTSPPTDFFNFGSGQYASGYNIKRHLEEAYYVPLGRKLDETLPLRVQFDANYLGSGVTSHQGVNYGFFNSTTWFEDGTPDAFDPRDTVFMILNHDGSPDPRGSAWVRVATTAEALRQDATHYTVTNNQFNSYELVYTPEAGANNAGQVVLTGYAPGDIGGTPLFTSTADLQAGDAFEVDAFGIFTGHLPGNSSDGFNVFLDNVTVFVPIPEPAAFGLLAGLLLCLHRRRRG